MFDQIIAAGNNEEVQNNLPAPPSESQLFLDGEPIAEEHDGDAPPPKPKRNSGRTGATSLAGRQRAAQNSLKHGACAVTLILPYESEAAFFILLARWCSDYQIPEEELTRINNADCDSCSDHGLTYDFVRRAANADWRRMRCERNYDAYNRQYLEGRPPHKWTPEEQKMHDLNFRYKTAADRAFQRENRALQQHVKFMQQLNQQRPPQQQPQPPQAAAEAATPKATPAFRVVAVDPNSPTGYSLITEIIDGVENNIRRPIEPPNPIPAHWPKPNFPIKARPLAPEPRT